MGQRYLQLNNTYTVNSDGSYVLHVAQAPPNPNLFQPGPALLFVVVDGIPSNGTYVIAGTGDIGTQPTSAAASLPANVRLDSAQGTGAGSSKSSSTSSSQTSGSTSHTGSIVGGIIAAIAVVGILGAVFGICLTRRRRRAASQLTAGAAYPMGAAPNVGGSIGGAYAARGDVRNSDSSAFVPLQQDNYSTTWAPNASQLSLQSPYRDDFTGGGSKSGEFDPYYQNVPRMSTNAAR